MGMRAAVLWDPRPQIARSFYPEGGFGSSLGASLQHDFCQGGLHATSTPPASIPAERLRVHSGPRPVDSLTQHRSAREEAATPEEADEAAGRVMPRITSCATLE